MSLSKDERGVSEIVGALMLVVVVSSAVVGFGMFLSQQAKLTQEQKAAELARSLEILEITSVTPTNVDFLDGACTIDPAGDGDWNSLAFRITSLHLHDSRVSALRVNGLVVRYAVVDLEEEMVAGVTVSTLNAVASGDFSSDSVGREITGAGIAPGTTILSFDDNTGDVMMSANGQVDGAVPNAKLGDRHIDFNLGPGQDGYSSWKIPARNSALVTLENVANDLHSVDCLGPYSFFGTAEGAITTTDSIQVELVTELTNTVERVFIPPSAIATLEPTPGVADSYTLVGTRSLPGSDDAYLVKWSWEVFERPDAAGPAPCSGTVLDPAPINMSGHRLQISTDSTEEYCVRLTVTDNNGLSASTEFSFDP